MDRFRHRQGRGATLGIVAGCVFLLTILGSVCYFLISMIGGNKQVANATDAGALAAARSLLSITIPATNLTSEFQQLGVDLDTGAPNPTTGQMNILAYNRAAGAALLIALNANEEATSQAYSNANAVILNLKSFGDALNTAITNSTVIGALSANIFEQVAQQNNISLMGNNSVVNLTGGLQIAAVDGLNTGSKSNVYFNSATFGNDTALATSAGLCLDTQGLITSTASQTYASNQAGASGQRFVKGYTGIQVNSNIKPIYTCAINPGQMPHLIDVGRFTTGSPSPVTVTNGTTSTPSGTYNYAPVNAIMGQTQTQITSLASQTQANLASNAAASAILGSINNEYPISLPSGYVRIHNGPDAMYANPTTLSPIYDSVNCNNNIFNNELYAGVGGFGPIYVSNNGVFCTESWESAQGPANTAPANYLGSSEIEAWVTYNNSTGSDPFGKNAALDPSNPANSASLGLSYVSPSNNMRIGSNTNQQAQITDMRAITSVAGTCVSTMYDGSSATGACLSYVNSWIFNYDRGVAAGAAPIQEGQSSGGLTLLEYAKGQVITDFQDLLNSNALYYGHPNYRYSIDFGGDNGSEFQNPSGSKLYSRNVGYATPQNSTSVAFATLGSPGQLCDQITGNSSSATINLADANYCSSNSVQGKLLQRCREIYPGATWAQIATLLYKYPIDLGQYQYIYFNPTSGALDISKTPPSQLANLPEGASPGITRPDGAGSAANPPSSYDNPWGASKGNSGPVGSIINSTYGTDGNVTGDNGLETAPFDQFRGSVSTYDSVSFTVSSGKDNLLGEMQFNNYVTGSGQFSSPN